PHGVGGEFEGSILLQIWLLHYKIETGGKGGEQHPQRPRFDTELPAFTEANRCDTEKADCHSHPTHGPEPLLEERYGPERGKGRYGGYEQTGRTGRNGQLPVGQKHGEGAECEKTRQSQRWEIPCLRQAYSAEHGGKNEYEGSDQESQQRKGTGRVAMEPDFCAGESRGREEHGRHHSEPKHHVFTRTQSSHLPSC